MQTRTTLAKTTLFVVTIIVASMLLALNPQIALAQEFGHYGGIIPKNCLIGGTITNDVHYVEYTFSGNSGEEVFITLQAIGDDDWNLFGDLDPLLMLRGPGIETPLENDDWFGLNSFLQVTLPEDGAYTVTANRWEKGAGTTTGDYLLLVTKKHPVVAYYGILSPNQCIVGAISDEIYAVEHTFSGIAGQEVTITMERLSWGLNTFLSLRGPGIETPLKNDDGWFGRDSILHLTLNRTGAYTISASRSDGEDGSSSGLYKLCLKSDPYVPGQGDVLRPHQIILVDTSIPSQPDSITYSFDYYHELAHGAAATVMLPNIDGQRPALQLYDPNGNQIASVSTNSQFATLDCPQMPQEGTYTITVEGQLIGFYTICLRDSAYAR